MENKIYAIRAAIILAKTFGREDFVSWREIEICRHEKKIAECKLRLVCHEIAFLRERQDMHSRNREHQREAITKIV